DGELLEKVEARVPMARGQADQHQLILIAFPPLIDAL
ncbi:MAG: hypothetical protein JWQ64_2062, partial [Subtercola sp.]|nr:hypothetical protein [Subtercola sp.]